MVSSSEQCRYARNSLGIERKFAPLRLDVGCVVDEVVQLPASDGCNLLRGSLAKGVKPFSIKDSEKPLDTRLQGRKISYIGGRNVHVLLRFRERIELFRTTRIAN